MNLLDQIIEVTYRRKHLHDCIKVLYNHNSDTAESRSGIYLLKKYQQATQELRTLEDERWQALKKDQRQ